MARRTRNRRHIAPSFSHSLIVADAGANASGPSRSPISASYIPVIKEERLRLLNARREAKMTASAHAYVRGSTHRFYDWLLSSRGESLPRPPDIWIGGDCHVGNIGALAHADGNVELELRDLDQTVIGSPAHDVVRLALSMVMSVRASGLRGALALRGVEAIARGYERVLTARACKRDASPGVAPPQVKRLLRQATTRSRKDLLRRVGLSAKLPIGRRFWPLSAEEHAAVEKLTKSRKLKKLVTQITGRNNDADVTLVDAAYWVKGCSSLGLWRVAALVRVGGKRRGTLALIDIKEARKALAPRARGLTLPAHDGERVVLGARALSPHLGPRMMAATLLGVPVYVRELMPQDLKLELEILGEEDVGPVGEYLGSVVGIAHARQLSPSDSATWLGTFRKETAPHSSAPAWLWSAVVDLVALHEGAYLEHCREHEQEAERGRA